MENSAIFGNWDTVTVHPCGARGILEIVDDPKLDTHHAKQGLVGTFERIEYGYKRKKKQYSPIRCLDLSVSPFRR